MDAEADAGQTPGFRAITGGLALLERVVPARLLPGHDPAGLMRAAGAQPCGGAIQGLLELTAAINADSELTMFGRLSARWDFLRLLRNAQFIEDQHRREPRLAASPVAAPIFILGLPRSGTTFLHALLAEDAANLVPRNWQTIYPAPRPPDFSPTRDKRARKVDAQLRLFAGMAPEFPAVHPISADSPQECSEMTAHVFQSLRFDTTFRVPLYRAWLDARGHDEAFAFHRKFLQFLQNGLTPRRWVLKCPDHIFSMDSILRTYPDARFVVVHRDPVRVFGSVAHLTGVLRRPFVKNVDMSDIGRQVAERWIDGAARLVAFDRRKDVPAGRKIHLHYEDLVAAPQAAVERIYAQFGMQLSAPAVAAMRRRLQARPDGGYGRRRYLTGSFGVNPDSLGARFAGYLEYFGIDRQPAE